MSRTNPSFQSLRRVLEEPGVPPAWVAGLLNTGLPEPDMSINLAGLWARTVINLASGGSSAAQRDPLATFQRP